MPGEEVEVERGPIELWSNPMFRGQVADSQRRRQETVGSVSQSRERGAERC